MDPSKRIQRSKKPPLKYQDNGLAQLEPISSSKEVWCTVVLTSAPRGKEYVVCSNHLVTLLGDTLGEKSFYMGNRVLWNSKGRKYEVEIMEVSREKPTTKVLKPRQIFVEDSSDTDGDEGVELTETQLLSVVSSPPKKKLKTSSTSHRKVAGNDSKPHRSAQAKQPLHEVHDVIPFADDNSPYSSPKKENVPFADVTSGSDSSHYKTQGQCNCMESLHKKMDEMSRLLVSIISQQEPRRKAVLATQSDHHTAQKVEVKDEVKADPEFVHNGMDLLAVRANDPCKYSLSLMDVIFTTDEMATCCYEATKRSKNPPLDKERVKLLEDCVKHRFGLKAFTEKSVEIRRKCNQKCIDRMNKVKLSHVLQGENTTTEN